MVRIDGLYSRSYPRLLKADYAPSLLVTVVPLFSKAQLKLVTSGTYFVAEREDGALIGAGGWTKIGPMGEMSDGMGHIRHFATDPDVLRAGVGRAVMEACVAQAYDAGLGELSCYSTITAVPFYEAQGFVVKGEMQLQFAQAMRFPAVWMERRL